MQRAPFVVIGAGIAGLSAALRLQDLGHSVVVYDARPQVGGRIDTRHCPAGAVETGMQFYYGSYTQAHRLLRRFNLQKSLQPIAVRGDMLYRGQVHPFSKTKPWLRALSAKQHLSLYGRMMRKLPTVLARSVFDYATHEPADAIDTANYFGADGLGDLVELVARPLTTSYAFTEPEGHSLGMLLRILRLGATSKTYGLVRGNDSLPKAMASELDVRQGRALALLQSGGRVDGVQLSTDTGIINARAAGVIVAVGGPDAAPLLSSIGTRPAMKAAADLEQLTYSSVILATLHLDRALDGGWVYVMSRNDGQRGAFAIDLMRRAPAMFPQKRSVLQVNFASPVSDALLARTDDDVVAQALADLEPFIPNIRQMVTDRHVVRRPKAHPSFPCGMQSTVRRAQSHLADVDGVNLAGDYLRAPLCEGAIRSGLDAATHLLQSKPLEDHLRTDRRAA